MLTSQVSSGFHSPAGGALVPLPGEASWAQFLCGAALFVVGFTASRAARWERGSHFSLFFSPALIPFQLILAWLCMHLIFISKPTVPAPHCVSATLLQPHLSARPHPHLGWVH